MVKNNKHNQTISPTDKPSKLIQGIKGEIDFSYLKFSIKIKERFSIGNQMDKELKKRLDSIDEKLDELDIWSTEVWKKIQHYEYLYEEYEFEKREKAGLAQLEVEKEAELSEWSSLKIKAEIEEKYAKKETEFLIRLEKRDWEQYQEL